MGPLRQLNQDGANPNRHLIDIGRNIPEHYKGYQGPVIHVIDDSPQDIDWGWGLPIAKGPATVRMRGEAAIILSPQAFEQLFAYAGVTKREISCLGTITRIDRFVFRIGKFYLIEQESGHANTEMKQEGIGKLVEKLLLNGKKEEATSIKCWAHSHPGMKTFWSQTDVNTIEELTTDYLVSVVVSDNFQILGRVDTGGDFSVTIDNIPIYVEHKFPTETEMKKYEDEVKEKVKYSVAVTTYYHHGINEKVDLRDDNFGNKNIECSICKGEHSTSCCPTLANGRNDDWFGM